MIYNYNNDKFIYDFIILIGTIVHRMWVWVWACVLACVCGGVVYFDQWTSAPHDVRWLKSIFWGKNNFLHTFKS